MNVKNNGKLKRMRIFRALIPLMDNICNLDEAYLQMSNHQHRIQTAPYCLLVFDVVSIRY